MKWKLVKHNKGTKWHPSESKRYEAKYGDNIILVVEGSNGVGIQHEWWWGYHVEKHTAKNAYRITTDPIVPEDYDSANLNKAKALCEAIANDLLLT